MTQVINASEFQAKVLDVEGPVLVDFFATWCGPCKMLSPIIDEIAQEKQGSVAVYKVDVDQSADLAGQYNIMSVPTLMVFKNGKVVNQALEVLPKQAILGML